MLAIVAHYHYEVWKMDIKTTFLHMNTVKDVYMAQLEDYIHVKFPNNVFNIEKSILTGFTKNNILCAHANPNA